MIFQKIPGKLNNRTIVGAIDTLRKIEKLISRDFRANDALNKDAFEKLMGGTDHKAYHPAGSRASLSAVLPLIERQSELREMSLGKSTLDYSGCEVIAVYNLLLRYRNGGMRVMLPELIEYFEHDGILYAGRFGVSPRAIAEYLRRLGIDTNFTLDESDFDVLGFFCDHFILTVMNDRENIMRQVHTFYISKEGDHFMAHNAGLRMKYFSISEIIKALPGGRAKGLCLIGIKDPPEEE